MSEPLVKVCGATAPADLALLGAAGADLVGLWWRVRGGHADLSRAQVVALAGAGGPRPVLVTFSGDARGVLDVVRRSGVRWVQLHGYQPPSVVRALKAEPGLTVVKVLHLRGTGCVERPLLAAYERAGTDCFLLDAVGPDGALGSTGRTLDEAAVLAVVAETSRPFLLAGGLSAANAGNFAAVRAHPRFAGIDVDSGARDRYGRFCRERVLGLRRGWTR
ncbi:hypothetical protein V5P93_004481 [Actinokineospora auranticolor]|uniref:N-(5'-phosphoribosyl)anthranilate isomerase n=1 Tax=Actinokineospora auranticolor TaxID=155976 RepID=A0A2S6GTG0_9PSEU|nr:N-(5'-phosphoribosyl)anthranilate isomerase [Actinokineospora auranticolor]PPK68411.1 phosphoribosylanthranilate isomerase [Actinokineospora auranticolor]